NADGGGSRIDINGEDAVFKKLGITRISYEIRDCKVESYEPQPPKTTQTIIDSITNNSDGEVTKTSTIERGRSYSTQTSVTNGFKATATAGLKLEIASAEISVEVSTSRTETVGGSKEEKTTDSITFKIPPKSKVVNYRWSTNQIARFTGKLRVSGQVGVYFNNAICNAFGDSSTDHHYKWFPSADRIVRWAFDQGYADWFIDDEGYGYFAINGKSEATIHEFIVGEPEPL
ncbi:unnamed protein product, partial [Didymodactylos carnosus]